MNGADCSWLGFAMMLFRRELLHFEQVCSLYLQRKTVELHVKIHMSLSKILQDKCILILEKFLLKFLISYSTLLLENTTVLRISCI